MSTDPGGSAATPGRVRALPCIAALLALAAYANTLPNGFVFDDARAITENPVVRGALSLRALFTSDYWGHSLGAGVPNGSFRPLVSLLFGCLFHLGGGSALPFHLANALLHGLSSALFARWIARSLPATPALLASAWFALHPLHTDAVSSLVGCADVLAFSLSMVCLRAHGEDSVRGAAASLTALSLALLTKESAVVLPALLMLQDLAARRRCTPRLAARYLLVGLLTALLLAYRVRLFGSAQGFGPDSLANPLCDARGLSRALSVVTLFGKGISLLIAPVDLLPDRGRAVTQVIASPTPETLLGALSILGLSAMLLHAIRARNAPRAQGLSWLLVPGLLSVHALVLLPTAFAERLWYLPSAGAAWLVGEGAAWLQSRGARRLVATLGALVCALFFAMTAARNREWRDEESLYSSSVRVDGRGAAMQFNLAAVRFDQGRYPEAIGRCQIAARMAPAWPDPHGCIGIALDALGRRVEAERAFRVMTSMPQPSVHWWLRYIDMLRRQGRTRDARRELARMRSRGVRELSLRAMAASLDAADHPLP